MKLPIFIQRRLFSFNSYVREKLFPDVYIGTLLKNKKTDERKNILKNINLVISECSYACFVFSLRQFFEEGTMAAEEAVDVLNGLGIESFNIGKKEYSKNNQNVNEGKELYKTMLNSISDKQLREIIENSTYFSEIIDRYRNVLF